MYHNENMALRIPPKRDPNQKDKMWWYCIDGDTSHYQLGRLVARLSVEERLFQVWVWLYLADDQGKIRYVSTVALSWLGLLFPVVFAFLAQSPYLPPSCR